jgi:hypothetical protein
MSMSNGNGANGRHLKKGDLVLLQVPENPRMNGTEATIETPTEWGAMLLAPAAATGKFRALYEEMLPLKITRHKTITPNDHCYSGDICDKCGSTKMRRSGRCLVCEDCGDNTGCG